jgi:hypothetical protein
VRDRAEVRGLGATIIMKSVRSLHAFASRRKVDEALAHRHVRDVHRPHLVRPRDLHAAQQVREDLVAGRRLRRARTAMSASIPIRDISVFT